VQVIFTGHDTVDFANGGDIRGLSVRSTPYLTVSDDCTKIVPGHGTRS